MSSVWVTDGWGGHSCGDRGSRDGELRACASGVGPRLGSGL